MDKVIIMIGFWLIFFNGVTFAKRICPPPSYVRSVTSFNTLDISPSKDGRWKFYSEDTFWFEDKDHFYNYWNVSLELKIPNIVSPKEAMIYANKQIKNLLMAKPEETSANYCDYTPDGADYVIKAHNPPVGP